MNDYSIPDLATMPARPSPWMMNQLAGALSTDIALAALTDLAENGTTNLTVSASLSKNDSEREDYTCDKCREFHPAGLNVAITAFGRDTEFAQITVTNPVALFDWAAVVVQIGLCHPCWDSEGYPPSPLTALDDGFVQQAVRLMEAPDLATITDWKE